MLWNTLYNYRFIQKPRTSPASHHLSPLSKEDNYVNYFSKQGTGRKKGICTFAFMQLDTIDWVIIAAYLLLSLAIGLYYKNRAGKSLSDFFLGGRNLPWHVAGISMVATTF